MDAYCERTASGIFGEPFNAGSNLAFFLAAWLCWRMARRRDTADPGVCVLIALIAALGAGSTIFHVFHTRFTQLFDAGPIFLFQVAFLWIYSRRVFNFSAGLTMLVLSGFLASMWMCAFFHGLLNNSLVYAPALVMMIVYGIVTAATKKNERLFLFLGAAAFFFSLVFRTIDMLICPCFPVGTHFLWHIFNSVMLCFVMRALIVNAAPASRQPS